MGHTYSIITNTKNILKVETKGKHLNTLEKYYIYKISKDNLHMNDVNIKTHNSIFQALNELNDR
jgi:hypothetical protein